MTGACVDPASLEPEEPEPTDEETSTDEETKDSTSDDETSTTDEKTEEKTVAPVAELVEDLNKKVEYDDTRIPKGDAISIPEEKLAEMAVEEIENIFAINQAASDIVNFSANKIAERKAAGFDDSPPQAKSTMSDSGEFSISLSAVTQMLGATSLDTEKKANDLGF